MKFNSQKLAEDLRHERVVKQGISVPKAAAAVGIANSVYTRAEKDWGMDILVFTKLVTWLGTNPANYFIDIDKPKGNLITREILLMNGAVEVEDSWFYHIKISDNAYLAISIDDHSFIIHGGRDEHNRGYFAAFDPHIKFVPQLEQLWFDLTGELKQFKI